MNISIVTTFSIGGLIILSILTLNRNMMLHSAESTVELMSQYRQEELIDMITHDLSRIGYGFPTGGDEVEIKQLEDEKIRFTADVLENGVHGITWELTEFSATNTQNPNDKILRRTGTMGSGTPSDLETDYNVIDFKIIGYRDIFGEEETTSPGEVQSLRVIIAYESEIPSNIQNIRLEDYETKYWSKLIVPKNLQFKD